MILELLPQRAVAHHQPPCGPSIVVPQPIQRGQKIEGAFLVDELAGEEEDHGAWWNTERLPRIGHRAPDRIDRLLEKLVVDAVRGTEQSGAWNPVVPIIFLTARSYRQAGVEGPQTPWVNQPFGRWPECSAGGGQL